MATFVTGNFESGIGSFKEVLAKVIERTNF